MLLHDVILMEVRSMTLRYEARKKREQCKKKAKLENRIDEIQNLNLEEDILEEEDHKNELQDLEDERNMEEARKA